MATKKPRKSGRATVRKKPIDREVAKTLVENYRNEFYGDRRVSNLSRYATFDLNDLVEFLLRMKTDHGADDVRIYYGARQVKVDGVYKYMITPVIVTTIRGFVGEGGEDPEIFEDVPAGKNAALAVVSGYDFASLCPPDARHIRSKDASISFDVYEMRRKAGVKKPGSEKYSNT